MLLARRLAMLVLTRSKDETIVAGTYRITVIEIGEDVVKLRLDRQLWKHKTRRLCQFWVAIGEEFDIGEAYEDIEGQLTEIKGDRVRIGIKADRDEVPVDRLEVYEEKVRPQGRRPNRRSYARLPSTLSPPQRRRHAEPVRDAKH